MKTILFLLLVMILGCNNPRLDEPKGDLLEPRPAAKGEALEYEFTEVYPSESVRCRTGAHAFETTEALCEALKSRDLNRNCAFEARQEHFVEAECEGEFEETNYPFFLTHSEIVRGQTCTMEYIGPNPLPTKGDYCRTLREVFSAYGCGRERLLADFEEAQCPGDFPL